MKTAVRWLASDGGDSTLEHFTGEADCADAESSQSGFKLTADSQPLKAEKISDTFWPPNPKLLERARVTFPWRASFGM